MIIYIYLGFGFSIQSYVAMVPALVPTDVGIHIDQLELYIEMLNLNQHLLERLHFVLLAITLMARTKSAF